MQLYIPIWFYSNGSPKLYCFPNLKNFTFQSGSIQIQMPANRVIFNNVLYIPIWFYSNFVSLVACFAFYVFTFQSGSIQMPTSTSYVLSTKYFTFQSGSIQIPCSSISTALSVFFTFQSGSIQMTDR